MWGVAMDELELVKSVLAQCKVWSTGHPTSSGLIAAFVIFVLFICGKFRGKIMVAIFRKVPFGKLLEKRYEKNIEEELKILHEDEAQPIGSNNTPIISDSDKKDFLTDPLPDSNESDPNKNRSNYTEN